MHTKFGQILLALPILLLLLPKFTWASTAWSSVESQVQAGQAEIYQSVETTVNGQTVRKESNQAGRLELKMEQTASGSPTVTFTQELFSPAPMLASSSGVATSVAAESKGSSASSFATSIIEFTRKLFGNLSSFFKLLLPPTPTSGV